MKGKNNEKRHQDGSLGREHWDRWLRADSYLGRPGRQQPEYGQEPAKAS
jgi:hypothetical protein